MVTSVYSVMAVISLIKKKKLGIILTETNTLHKYVFISVIKIENIKSRIDESYREKNLYKSSAE